MRFSRLRLAYKHACFGSTAERGRHQVTTKWEDQLVIVCLLYYDSFDIDHDGEE